MNNNSINEFQQKLEREYNWPALYMFKFIVPKGNESEIRKLFPKNDILEKLSNKGNYFSLTVKMMIGSSDDVIRIYTEASRVEGVIAL